ncbi:MULTISPECIES: YihY/virulence factor BrkB family protein [unclassified Streptococcus]|uniref:YihY/virulence factor BrkB family protein n=1 Tax=unclassified Streptococcus TaxID=2608887 RepID=UPI001072AFAF|nr:MULTISPECIES: YihY/virulence factor BrkB family protein [unclassified Streptococcus]MBF0788228.1 YihY/virulence factor BrkB family protein [Streptococcus sp. 19428wC2_LYSM12]MCQ9212181.1 YihY/virulence factor BrkB family protein [Streptococcus sp. B01]MCQ9213511.1 YihY/virulence factor BrkB family protein [Streptococcus sp. O1]TFV04697.1 YihY/virulence factor BrkB family protein [Streptococcus sp. LYSM12]
MNKEKLWSNCRSFVTSFLTFYKSAELDLTGVAVAYYLIISVFPILLTLANLLPYLQIDVKQILDVLVEVFPEKLYPTVADMVVSILTRPSSSWLGIAIVTTLWTLSKSMAALQKAVNKAYGVGQHRDFIISRIVGMFLGIGLQGIIIFSVMMLAFGKTLLQLMSTKFHFDPLFDNLLSQTQLVAYIALFLALVMLYFFLPNVRIKKIRYVLPGSLFVLAVMATVGQVFGIYIDSYANRFLDFRLVTSVIILVLMLWFIFVANILIIGAVLNATVQSLQVEEFAPRPGDVMSIFYRLKARFTRRNDTKKNS